MGGNEARWTSKQPSCSVFPELLLQESKQTEKGAGVKKFSILQSLENARKGRERASRKHWSLLWNNVSQMLATEYAQPLGSNPWWTLLPSLSFHQLLLLHKNTRACTCVVSMGPCHQPMLFVGPGPVFASVIPQSAPVIPGLFGSVSRQSLPASCRHPWVLLLLALAHSVGNICLLRTDGGHLREQFSQSSWSEKINGRD